MSNQKYYISEQLLVVDFTESKSKESKLAENQDFADGEKQQQ